MARPRTYDDTFGAQVADAAGELLAAEGPGSLTVRRLAEEVGASTGAIYRVIGTKDDIVRAMYLEGFRRLAASLQEVPDDLAPRERLRALAFAYQDAALASPHLYTVMFERPIPEFCPTGEDTAYALRTLGVLVDAVATAIDAGVIAARRDDAADLAVRLWATNHGITSLAIAEMLGDDPTVQARTHLEATVEALLDGLGPHAEESRSGRPSLG